MGHTLNLPASMDATEYVTSIVYALHDDGELDIHDLDAVRTAAEDAARMISRDHWQAIANLAIGEIMFEEAVA